MQYTVLNVAYPLVPVSADTAGGAEQIVSILDRQIAGTGWRSLIVGASGSRVAGELIPTPQWTGRIDENIRAWAAAAHRRAVELALREHEIDLIHFHGLDFYEYLPSSRSVACLATLHLPTAWYPASLFRERRPNFRLICVSDHQRRHCPPARVPVETIPQGIDVDSLAAPVKKGQYAAVLGRICPEKGFHFAIEAAAKAGVPLIIAGQVFPYEAHQKYFRREIVPRLRRTVRFIGHAGFRKKRRLLSGARCLLIPSTVAETSSLVAMEALACGTPVIAFRSGALPELIEHGRTGFIVENANQMAHAIRRVEELDPDRCRESARVRFSAARMAQEYFRIYRDMVAETGFSCASVS
ncbi:MAG: glycosyltransferase family 4 protein [Acidobacteriia bacterium]|nr:glycosyltransferase family 4 protein [Terriglobia bacterium]